VRSYYATPWDLRYRPWSLDITPDNAGNPPFPFNAISDPTGSPPLEWVTDDWDPALRFWTLPFDPNLGEWLKAVDPRKPSILAAREFAGQVHLWGPNTAFLESNTWLEPGDLGWRPSTTVTSAAAFQFIRAEIGQLQQLMQDDRERYLDEIEAQADGLAEYVIAFIGANQERHPWTIELINCGLAMGNVAYMRWKSLYKRVRPSTLCPGLIPPFGPPGHPSFPSGHSTLGHLIALLLLEIPELRRRHGKFASNASTTGAAVTMNDLAGRNAIPSPLMWLGARLATNRERLGVHYPSDSFGGRHLAAAMWNALLHDTTATAIDCPSLRKVLDRAKAEWLP
jgi:hypothetical protein